MYMSWTKSNMASERSGRGAYFRADVRTLACHSGRRESARARSCADLQYSSLKMNLKRPIHATYGGGGLPEEGRGHGRKG